MTGLRTERVGLYKAVASESWTLNCKACHMYLLELG